MRVLIVGCGYVGIPLGAALVRAGHEVYGLRRGGMHADELRDAGIHPLIADLTKLEQLATLPRAYDWVVNCVSSSGVAERPIIERFTWKECEIFSRGCRGVRRKS